MITIPGSVSRLLNRLQGFGLIALTALLVVSFVLNIANVGFDGLQILAFLVFAAIAVMILLDTFVRGTPRLANDGALILALGSFAVSVAWFIGQASPAADGYSDGFGVWVAMIGGVVAVAGGLMSIFAAPYAARVPISNGVSLSTIVISILSALLLWGGASAAWLVDERAGADAANRIFVKGLASDGPLMGWPVVIFGLGAVVVALLIAVSGSDGPFRWRLGTIVTGMALGVFALSMAFTLSISRSGDTDYQNDRGALTGAGILLALVGAGALMSLGRSVIGDFRRRRVYLGEGGVGHDEALIEATDAAEELVGAAR